MAELAVGLVFAFAMASAKVGFEHTDAGRTIELATYGFLHRNFITPPKVVPIMVVDISGMDSEVAKLHEGTPNEREIEVTSRVALKRLIDCLFANGAKAVGVDVDFSPKVDGTYVTPNDVDFFRSLNQMAGGKKVYLGVYRSRFGHAESWLGSAEFASLAACIDIPRDQPGDRRFLLEGMRLSSQKDILPGLGRALGRGIKPDPAPLPRWLAWLVHDRRQMVRAEDAEDQLTATEYLADYSGLQMIRAETGVASADGATVSRIDNVSGKVVLCAEMTEGKFSEAFVLSGIDSLAVPGGLLHACGAITSSQGRLMELSHEGRVVVDLVISLAVLGSFLLLRERLRNKVRGPVNQAFLERFTLSAMCVLVLLLGWLLACCVRLLWTDYVIVWVTLIMHRAVHDIAHLLGNFFTTTFYHASELSNYEADH